MTPRIGRRFFLCLLLTVCCIAVGDGSSQPNQTLGNEGKLINIPKSIDVVRFKQYEQGHWQEYSLNQVELNWEKLNHLYMIRQMGHVRHPDVVQFLYRIAVVDHSLYRIARPHQRNFGEFAIENMVLTGDPSVPSKLQEILKCSFEGVDEQEVRHIKGRSAQELLRFKGVLKDIAYKVLDENAQAGYLRCPYPNGTYVRQPHGRWVGPSIDGEARKLLNKWLRLENRQLQLEAALCAANAGIKNDNLRDLASTELHRTENSPDKTPTREQFLAEQILEALAGYGDKTAERENDKINIERRIKALADRNPAAEKSVRAHLEKKFKEKWGQ